MLNQEAVLSLRNLFRQEIEKVSSIDELETLRIKYVGRSQGELTRLISEIPKLPTLKKRQLAPLLINLKEEVEQEIDEKKKQFLGENSLREEIIIDPTISRGKFEKGHPHPTQKIIDEIKEIFHYLGFSYADGPEVELDLYNFQKLRLHKDHPARDMQQTFYLDDEILLRTQTSSMQIRYMESHKPPIRMLFPGRTYRREQIDATHLPSFYQIEGLLVDETTTMTDLLGSLDFFIKKMFGTRTKTRIYGHHFPYTEPSIEVEVLHKSGKWLEILGAGMVHPEVLKNCGLDSKKYRGWAFGMGPERIAMLKYSINDIRLFYSNDLSFLEQF